MGQTDPVNSALSLHPQCTSNCGFIWYGTLQVFLCVPFCVCRNNKILILILIVILVPKCFQPRSIIKNELIKLKIKFTIQILSDPKATRCLSNFLPTSGALL